MKAWIILMPELYRKIEEGDEFINCSFDYYQFENYQVANITIAQEKLNYVVFFPKRKKVKVCNPAIIYKFNEQDMLKELYLASKWMTLPYPLVKILETDKNIKIRKKLKTQYGKEAIKLVQKYAFKDLHVLYKNELKKALKTRDPITKKKIIAFSDIIHYAFVNYNELTEE